MADDGSGGLSIPNNDNWNEWTFEQALKALTGEGADLHTPAKATWFNWNPKPTVDGGDWWQYHAWGQSYFGVNLNNDAITAWAKAVDAIDEMMPDVARGKRGSMDSFTLTQLQYAIYDFATWSQNTGGGFDQWASRLNSDDSSFKGKAAFLIYWRLKVQGDGLKDTYEQLSSRHGRPIYASVADAAQQLHIFNSTMSRSWQIAVNYGIRTWISDQISAMSDRLNMYLQSMGLYKGTPQYILDGMVDSDGLEYTKAYIRDTLSGSDYGDLTQEGTWTSMGDRITQNALNNLKGFLDGPAQTSIGALAPKYVMATSSLIEIAAPPPETPPKTATDPPDGGGGNNKDNLPPPPDGGGGGNDKINIPPPPDGGGGGGNDKLNIPPADGGGGGGGGVDGLNPPNGDGGSGGLNLADGGGGPNGLNVPGGGGPGLDLANGGGGPNGINPADGGGGPLADGGGGFVPGLVPPGGGANGDGGPNGKNGIGPGSDGAFNENGLGNDVVTPPADGSGGNGFSLVPSKSGNSGTLIPPGANGGGPNGLVDLGKSPNGVNGANGGLDIGPGGFGSDPGKGFGSGADLLGANGGAGNPLGGPGGLDNTGTNGLNGTSGLLNSGAPGADGTPGSPNGDGSGGVPFFPPMMGGGGAGAGGEKPQERERQTWLLEDEEIWGTRVNVRSGAIGRLDEEENEVEEVPLVGPTRRQRRAETPRRPRPDDKPDTERTTPSGEEVTGSA
jgi:hypothetical protein